MDRNVLDQLLPGRTEAEEKALKPFVRAVETAENKRERFLKRPRPTTHGGLLRRLEEQVERLPDFDAEVEEAVTALKKKCVLLAEGRRALLPRDAKDIRHGAGGGDLWDDRRYPIVCTSGQGVVSLGGCSTLGPAEERLHWFQREAKKVRSASRPRRR